MKTFMIILLLASFNVKASCIDEMTQLKVKFQSAMNKTFKTKLNPQIGFETLPDHIFAVARTAKNKIALNEKTICNNNSLFKKLIILHELGHFVAHTRHPEIKKDAYQQEKTIPLREHEAIANKYANVIITKQNITRESIENICISVPDLAISCAKATFILDN